MVDPAGGPGGPPLFLDQTEAQRAQKIFSETGPLPYLRAWMTVPPPQPPPLSERLDPPLYMLQVKIKFTLKFFHLG